MIDKTAIMNAANKLAAKGQIDKAIEEWEKLVKERKDGNVHNTIGDLHLRKGAEKEAKESFARAAELFRKDGFYPKAIAIYKKILNISPNDVDALIALAKLNADKGLTGNAVEHYYRAAEIYNKEGSPEKATMVVDKMLQLSPSDVSTRSKIAHLYFRIGLREKAANEYAAIALMYLERDDTDKAKEFFDKAIEYDSGNVSALVGMSKWALKVDRHDQAFDSLDNALAQDPNNADVLLTYAKLAMESGRMEDAKRAIALLIDLDPGNVETKKLVGAFHLKEDRPENAWEELYPVIDEALDAEQWPEAQALLQHFKDLFPLPVKQRLLRILRAEGNEDAVRSALKEMAALHEQEGAAEEALQLYKEALQRDSADAYALDKVQELEAGLGITQATINTFSEGLEGTEDRAATFPEHNEVHLPGMDTAVQGHNGELPVSPDPITLHLHESTQSRHHASSAYVTSQPDSPDEQIGPFETHNRMSDSYEAAADVPQGPGAMSDDDFIAKKAEADFYAQQGLDDEAVKAYEALLAAFPENEEIAQKLSSLQSVSPQAGGNNDMSLQYIVEEEAEPETNAQDDLEAIFAQFEKPAEEKVDYEAHYVAGIELKQKGRLDEAVRELQIAAGDPGKKQRNATMLALCYSEKGEYPLAIAEFNKVLESMSPAASMYLHVKYELATAHMKNRDLSSALELFSDVQAQAPDFKEVSSNVARIREQQSKVQPPNTKKSRVSYI